MDILQKNKSLSWKQGQVYIMQKICKKCKMKIQEERKTGIYIMQNTKGRGEGEWNDEQGKYIGLGEKN